MITKIKALKGFRKSSVVSQATGFLETEKRALS
jgi:hypothetical protein